MKLRTRILPKMLNSEVEEYLKHNDIIIVPVGTVEMHGGLPLDCETVVSEGIGLKLAEACDGLLLTGLPYFYAGATGSGRGTTQVSVRQGIDYLNAIAHSLLRQGFKRQIYISMHGPAHITCSALVRDFFDETGVPVLYMDMSVQVLSHASDLFRAKADDPLSILEASDAVMIAGYDIMGRLEDVPLTSEFQHTAPSTVAPFDSLFGLAFQSGGIGYCFGDPKDHAPTTALPTAEKRREMADRGLGIIDELVRRIDMPSVVGKMAELRTFEEGVMDRCPWMPSAWNQKA